MIIGYARVSTADQKLDAQIDALERVGAERLFSQTISGATAKRPELQRMLDQLREGGCGGRYSSMTALPVHFVIFFIVVLRQ